MGLSKLRATGAEPEPPPLPPAAFVLSPPGVRGRHGLCALFLRIPDPLQPVLGCRFPRPCPSDLQACPWFLLSLSEIPFRVFGVKGYRKAGDSAGEGGEPDAGVGVERGAVGGGRGRPGAPRVNISELRKEGGVRDATRLSPAPKSTRTRHGPPRGGRPFLSPPDPGAEGAAGCIFLAGSLPVLPPAPDG